MNYDEKKSLKILKNMKKEIKNFINKNKKKDLQKEQLKEVLLKIYKDLDYIYLTYVL
jgi:DNA-binding transcriptional regulator YhcF (GntR family)